MYMPYPFQIIQGTTTSRWSSEYKSALRNIYMNSTKKAPADSWMGWSNGQWEGETLVIDTTGFNDRAGSIGPGTSTATRCMWSNGLPPQSRII